MYDSRNWMGIISTLNDAKEFQKIHTLNRVQLIEDSLSFSMIGEMDYGITFQLLKYLKNENEYTPWVAALGGLSPIDKLMRRTPNQGVFQVSGNPFIDVPPPHVAFIVRNQFTYVSELYETHFVARVRPFPGHDRRAQGFRRNPFQKSHYGRSLSPPYERMH